MEDLRTAAGAGAEAGVAAEAPPGPIRDSIERREAAALAPWATRSANSRGREVPEEPHPYRGAFQRDRDRIIHCKAFRRLAHKTQVFMAPEGDHYRVRLTHTLEVTQVARTIARALGLNEDLAEAISLGHDLGHTPFGHLGEEVLSTFTGRPFRHNEQSLRIVDRLERRASGPGGEERWGLNLTWEVRDGILNHTWSMPEPATPEAAVARYADRIAYINHDIDDALRAGVLSPEDLPRSVRSALGESASERIEALVGAVISGGAAGGRVTMEPAIAEVMAEARSFLFERVYLRPEVAAEHERAREAVLTICRHYSEHPAELSSDGPPEPDPLVRLADYVAGMTDRFALREHARLRG